MNEVVFVHTQISCPPKLEAKQAIMISDKHLGIMAMSYRVGRIILFYCTSLVPGKHDFGGKSL